MAQKDHAAIATSMKHLVTPMEREHRDRTPAIDDAPKRPDSFEKQDLPHFEEARGPERTQIWLRELEKIFHTLPCGEVDKVTFAPYALSEGVGCWWEGTCRRLETGGTAVTWELFQGKFQEEGILEDAREKKKAKLQISSQDTTIMNEPATEFEKLSHCHPHYHDIPGDLTRNFEESREEKVAMTKNYGPHHHQKRGLDKKKPYRKFQRHQGSSSGPAKAQPFAGNQRPSANSDYKCYGCGGPHLLRNCPRRAATCFKCNKIGHMVRDCPELKKEGNRKNNNNEGRTSQPEVAGKVFTMSGEDLSRSYPTIGGKYIVCEDSVNCDV